MSNFHAVLIDECGHEFSAETVARNKRCAIDWFRENYPESKLADITTPNETRARERYRYRRLQRQYDNGDYDIY